MKITDDIEELKAGVVRLGDILEATNERLEALADPPFLRPLHQVNKAISIGLVMVSPITDKVWRRVFG